MRRGYLAGVTLLLLAAALGLPAEDGRNFAGFYKLGEITDLGEQVSVPLTVRIHSYSGADVIGAKIILGDSLLGEDLGSFATIVDIRDRESARAITWASARRRNPSRRRPCPSSCACRSMMRAGRWRRPEDRQGSLDHLPPRRE